MNHAVCIFCEATGATVKISKEHTFSNWINKVLTPEAVGSDLSMERTILHGPQAGTANTWPVKEVASHTVAVVCKPCNEGWMSQLETQVRPLIEPMILGQTATLTSDQQITVATWAALKTAVFEHVWTDQPVLTAQDRRLIMDHNMPPASMQVRLAAVESQGIPLQARARGYARPDSGDVAYCLTLVIGCIVVQSFAGPGAGEHGFRSVGANGPDYIGIYPPQLGNVQWPPAAVLNDTTLVGFTDPLGRAGSSTV